MLVLPYPAIDPALFTLDLGSMQFSLRWYALAYIAGLLAGWFLVARMMRRPGLWPDDRPPMPAAEVERLLTWMAVGVILGGRLGFVLFYRPEHYLANPAEILLIWQGGMSFHGGALGVILVIILWSRVNQAPQLSVADAVCTVTPIGLFLGRLANFINGELWGRPTDAPWAMVFPGAGGVPRHPSQLYEAVLEGAALFALLWWLGVRKGWLKRPGAVSGAFLAGYGLARGFVEFFRQADAQYVTDDNPWGQIIRTGSGPEAWGITMGQLLSLPMIAMGAILIAWAFRRRPAFM